MPGMRDLSSMPVYPTKRSFAQPASDGEGVADTQLFLQVADSQALKWAQGVMEASHYMHRRVHQRTRPMGMLVLQGSRVRRRVGCLLFNRPQCTAVNGWYCGSYQTLLAHPTRYRMTMWNILNLARVFLFSDVQRKDSPSYVYNAASRVVGTALRHVVRDYLLLFPPLYPDEPFELRECISYCESRRFLCTLYLASGFTEVRRNANGLITFRHTLRPLTHKEREAIIEASRVSDQQRRRRAERAYAQGYQQIPLFERLWPVLSCAELGLDVATKDAVRRAG